MNASPVPLPPVGPPKGRVAAAGTFVADGDLLPRDAGGKQPPKVEALGVPIEFIAFSLAKALRFRAEALRQPVVNVPVGFKTALADGRA
mgnify:CR=1 FL=1